MRPCGTSPRRRPAAGSSSRTSIAGSSTARPPVVYLVSILVGLGLDRVAPRTLVPRAVQPLGPLLVLLAVVLFVLSVREFRRAQTPIRTRKPVTAILDTGPYRFSRNPIYL